MSKAEISGSWHNNGYYGHLRSRPRNDFIVEYRHLAKPSPPRIFTKRAQQPSSNHVFSRHDNRHSFLNDALYFEEGLGRRRLENNTNRYEPNLLSWMSVDGRQVEPASVPLSSYMVEYRGVKVDATKLNQRINRRVKTSLNDVNRLSSTTAYRYTHSTDNPYLGEILHPGEGMVTINRIQKPLSHLSRDSVATCLSWYDPMPPPLPRKWLPSETRNNVTNTGALITTVDQILEPMTNTNRIEKSSTVTTNSMATTMSSAMTTTNSMATTMTSAMTTNSMATAMSSTKLFVI